MDWSKFEKVSFVNSQESGLHISIASIAKSQGVWAFSISRASPEAGHSYLTTLERTGPSLVRSVFFFKSWSVFAERIIFMPPTTGCPLIY